jgi:two-component system OmpR family response regulator
MNLLLVEDEIKIAEFVVRGLTTAGFQVEHVEDGVAAQKALSVHAYDLVVMDVMLPKLNGFEVLKSLRQEGNATPVIILSAKSDLSDRLHGFEIGADDYLPKPFFVEELVARIKVLHKRRNADDPVLEIVVEGLSLDVVNRKAQWHDVTAVLSQREFALLEYLMRSPGQIFTRKQILQHVWDIHFDPQTNVVDVCIQRIKRKLMRKDPAHDSPIESVRGVGYRLRVETLA